MNRKQRNNKKRWFVYDCKDAKIWRVASFFRHPNAEESRVNNNRKRARIASIAKNRKTGGCSDKNYPFRRKTFRKEVAQMWRKTFSRRQIKCLQNQAK